ncbi:hypothetical protein MNBD_GAMMA18-854 [hydrothermal vent metagenome]|uniref:Uncharacterized protein n=1 Tax=hydrothermal vent metagenome TaxID=652676 RepID=A0A3B0ZLU1_9ZZZZ
MLSAELAGRFTSPPRLDDFDFVVSIEEHRPIKYQEVMFVSLVIDLVGWIEPLIKVREMV